MNKKNVFASNSGRLPYFNRIAILSLSIAPIFSTAAEGAELAVPADFPTIQSAVDAAASGDVILVDAGVYVENVDFTGKAISLISAGGSAVTVIQAPGGKGVVMGPGGRVSGFTIRNATASFGAGIDVHGSDNVISENVFENNTQSGGGFGAAIGGNSASALISGNVFRENSCDNQFLSGVVAFVNSSSPRIENNIFHDNPCRAINFTLPTSGEPVVINNTIVRNQTGIRVDRRIDSSQQIYRNNIIVANDIGLEVDFGTEADNPTWEYNLVWGNLIDYDIISDQTGVQGNISADPLFLDSMNDDFHLSPGSAAVDSGTDIGAPALDFDGNVRPVDGDGDGIPMVDVGAYEFPDVLQVSMDIRPGSPINVVNPKSRGEMPVAVLGSADLDALQIDVSTVSFGSGNAPPLRDGRIADVNRDGFPDAVFHFDTQAAAFACSDTEAMLSGSTFAGKAFAATDAIATVGCR